MRIAIIKRAKERTLYRQVWTQKLSWKLKVWPRTVAMIVMLVCACLLTNYYCGRLNSTVYAHFFYLPIVIASIWWRRKGVAVAGFLSVMLLLGHFMLDSKGNITSDLVKVLMFLTVSVVVAELSEMAWRTEHEREVCHKKHEELLAEVVEEGNRTLVLSMEQLMFGMAITNIDGTIQFVNKAWATLHHMPKENFLGKHLGAFSEKEKLAEQISRLLEDTLKTGLRECEILDYGKSGKEFAVSVTSKLLRNDAEAPLGFMVSLCDITEQKHVEKKTKKINAELENFAHTVSHDLKGPLTAIGVAASTLDHLVNRHGTAKNRGEIHEMSNILGRNIDKASDLVDNILDLAKAGQVPKNAKPVNVSDVVSEILKEKAMVIAEKEIELKVDKNLGKISANPTHVYQLFSNLVDNAIAHNDNREPEIKILRLEEESPEIHRYLVRDNGASIPQESLDKIFDPFHSESSDGTGLGLSIVSRIVAQYDGDIRYFYDGGCCFEFTLRDINDS